MYIIVYCNMQLWSINYVMYHEVSVDRKTTCQSCQSESCARQRTPGTGEGCLRRPSTELMAPPVSGATQAVHHLPLARIFHHQKISKETLPEFLEFIGIQLLDKHRTGFFCWTVLPRSTVCFWLQPSQKLSDTGHPPDSACCSNGCGSGASGRCLKRFAARHRRVIWYCQTWSKSKNLNFLQTCNVFTKNNFKHMLQ